MFGYDIIGDIHGHMSLLVELLGQLGYIKKGELFFHPGGRKAVFVGDIINRGKETIEVLKIIQRMHIDNQAYIVLGNHEFRLLQQFTIEPSEIDSQLIEFIPWIQTLPLFLEFPQFKVVHAAWHVPSIRLLKNKKVKDENFIRSTMVKSSAVKEAVQIILRGISVPVPQDFEYFDRFGIKRKRARIRWWEKRRKIISGADFLPACEKMRSSSFENKNKFPEYSYSTDEPPVFFGHYCLPEHEPKVIHNLVCVDGCVTSGNVLWAYRHTPKHTISTDKLVHTRNRN